MPTKTDQIHDDSLIIQMSLPQVKDIISHSSSV